MIQFINSRYMASLLKERRSRARRKPQGYKPPLWKVLDETAGILSVSPEDIRGDCRKRQIVKARAVYAYFARQLGYSTTSIGDEMNRDHATVLHHTKNYEAYLDEGKPWFREDLKDEIDRIKRILRARLNYCA